MRENTNDSRVLQVVFLLGPDASLVGVPRACVWLGLWNLRHRRCVSFSFVTTVKGACHPQPLPCMLPASHAYLSERPLFASYRRLSCCYSCCCPVFSVTRPLSAVPSILYLPMTQRLFASFLLFPFSYVFLVKFCCVFNESSDKFNYRKLPITHL